MPWKLFIVAVLEYSKGSDITEPNHWTQLSMPSKEPVYNSYSLQSNINNDSGHVYWWTDNYWMNEILK